MEDGKEGGILSRLVRIIPNPFRQSEASLPSGEQIIKNANEIAVAAEKKSNRQELEIGARADVKAQGLNPDSPEGNAKVQEIVNSAQDSWMK